MYIREQPSVQWTPGVINNSFVSEVVVFTEDNEERTVLLSVVEGADRTWKWHAYGELGNEHGAALSLTEAKEKAEDCIKDVR